MTVPYAASPAARLPDLGEVSRGAAWLPWLAAFAALVEAASRAFTAARAGHSDDLMLLATLLAVLWMERDGLLASLTPAEGATRRWTGCLLFLAGCLANVAGRLSTSFAVETWGLFLLPAGLIALFAPAAHLRSVLFLVGSGTVVVALGRIAPAVLSAELGVTLAQACAVLLSATLMPVTADGVLLFFGPYVVEVTDACAGLNSIFSLTALAMLYLREDIKRNGWQIALLVACVIPVAVLTNFARIMLLVLSTRYVGDRFAQGVFHEMAGLFAFVVAIALLAGIDWLSRNAFASNEPGDARG